MIKETIVTNNSKVCRLPYYLRKLGISKKEKVAVTVLKLGSVEGVFISKDLLGLVSEDKLSRFLIETTTQSELLKQVKAVLENMPG